MGDRLTVELGARSYPIVVGRGLLDDSRHFVPHLAGKQVCIVTNDTVAALYLDRLRATLKGLVVDACVLPDGEQHKTLATYERVVDHLMAHRHGRQTTVVALGGGVVGDIAGFAAATYQRGVAFIQVPTTLLAQVDSSVGGKTGVNHPTGKNMIGAFHQPRCVVIDTQTLATLPAREYRAGLAEVVKYGVIRDRTFFEWLERNVGALLAREAEPLVHVIRTSCSIKASVVGADERESGERAILNFGHTFGHALETTAGFGALLHGEAVAIGMVMAADLSAALGRVTHADALRIKRLIERLGLPVRAAIAVDAAAIADAMAMDKKAVAGNIRLVLVEAIGKVSLVDDVPRDLVVRTVQKDDRLCHG